MAANPKGLPSILLASPRTSHLKRVCESLSREFNLVTALSGWDALKALEKRRYIALIADADLPGFSGFALLRKIQQEGLSQAPVVFMHGPQDLERARDCQKQGECARLLPVPFEEGDFISAIWQAADRHLEGLWDKKLTPLQRNLLKVTKTNIRRIFAGAAQEGVVDTAIVAEASRLVVEGARTEGLGDILDCLKEHHSYSFVHSLKVASLMAIFGVHVGMSRTDQELLAQGGLLHDIGKSRTPESLLNKPADLDPDEWAEMRRHVPLSGEILRNTPGIDPAIINIAEHHHEKLDGSGYPKGLTAKDLDDPSLVACIMDVYSALTDKRSYKPSMTPVQALEIMRHMSGNHLEEHFLKKFEEMIRSGAGGEF